jgi:hypothetical protein
MKCVRGFLAGILLLSAASASGLDSFRVGAMTPVYLDSQKSEAQIFEMGFSDALGIVFPKNPMFIRGVEIEIKSPQDIIAFRNSMGFAIYRQCQPFPSAKVIDYDAEQILLQSLPPKLSFVLQIPLQKNNGLKSGPYSTVLPYIHDASKGPVLFRLLPVMKGLPDNIESMKFTVKIRPILTDEGGMSLKIAYPDDKPKQVVIRVDENLVTNPDATLILPPGDHHLSIVSDDYRNEVRVFTVDSARITDVSVSMKDTTPRLNLVVPETAIVQIDGNPVESIKGSIVMVPGDHTIAFRIGDYEVSRVLAVEKGKDYTMTMIIDVTVTETP